MTFPPIPDQSHTFTGSWADSTHSVVWMTRSGKQRPLISAHRPASRQFASLLTTALLTLAIASNLIDVYGSPAAWAVAAVPATAIGCLVALAGNDIRPAA